MGEVIVRVRVNSTKQTAGYHKAENGKPLNHAIEMSVAHVSDNKDPNYPFAVLSGGTNFLLSTINDAAAAEFEIGGEYECTFRRVK